MDDDYQPRMEARVEDGIGWLTFWNPRRKNAVTLAMWRAIPGILDAFAADPEVKVVAVRGEGEAAFVSGADITEFETLRSTPEGVAAYEAAGTAAGTALQECPKPVVAVIRGWCVGGGMGTALNCDLRFAASDAVFAIPAARLGLGYRYQGVKRLADVVGPARAKEIFFTARRYPADEALAMGLIERVAPIEGFEAAAKAYLSDIAANAPLTVAAAKLAVNASRKDPEARDIAAVEAAVIGCFESEDYKEGRRAFAEKRKPVFRGV